LSSMKVMGPVLAMSMMCVSSVSAEEVEEVEEVEAEVPSGDELTVRVEPEVFDGEMLREWVQQQGRSVLDRRGPLASGDHIVIEIGGSPLDFVLTVQVYRQGERLPGDDDTSRCSCTTDELLAAVEQRVEQRIDRLDDAIRAEQEHAERERLAREQAMASKRRRRRAKQPPSAPEPYRPKRLGIVGAVGTGLAAAMLASGIGLVAAGQRPSDEDLLEPVDLRPSGLGLLGVGSTVLVTGVVLLVVDVVRCKKDEDRCAEREGGQGRAVGLRRWRMAWR
jgi:hypothetical protein